MKRYAICIPTYKRKQPLCLKMLKEDSNVELNLFVRQELLDEKFYDELEKRDRVNVISLGYGLHELGETRERIMQWCRDNEVKYCVMLDDGVYNIQSSIFSDIDSAYHITRTIELMCNRMDWEKENVIGASFMKYEAMNCYEHKTTLDKNIVEEYYLANVPTQAVLLDIKKCEKYDLHYKSLDKVGFEDCAFFVDALKKGCLYASAPQWLFAAIVPNAVKPGGSHEKTTNLEYKYDFQMKRCKEYLGNIYGVTLEKRWRNYAQSMLMMIEIDCKYFREVLLNPVVNKQIIDDQFKIK